MKRKIFYIFLILILFISFSAQLAEAYVIGRNYGYHQGHLQSNGSIVGADKAYWYNNWYYAVGPWSVYFDSSSNKHGTAMNFALTTTSVNNGYLVAGDDQWDDWVAEFGGDYNIINSKIPYSEVKTPTGYVKFAKLSEIAKLCGWRVKDWNAYDEWAIYEKIPSDQPPPDNPPDDPPADTNQDPVARFNWPSECWEGDTVDVTENSYDRDGQIVDWRWKFSDTTGVTSSLAQGGGTVTFDKQGTYSLKLTVEDDDGATDSVTKTIQVLPPIPTAKITYTGTLKENRQLILNANKSSSPENFPIDHTKDEWTITPVSVGTADDIKLGVRADKTQEVLFKKAGTYRVGLRVSNARCTSDWTYTDIVINPDLPPVADFIVSSIVFRNPSDSNNAGIKLTDKSYSTDDDYITQRIWKYKFDSNNDGSFLDETWVTLDSGNNTAPVLKTNHVGKYLFELQVKESFGQPTIPEFITDNDYRIDDTTLKPTDTKITDVKNLAPTTSFKATLKAKADILFSVTHYDPNNTPTLITKINDFLKPTLAAKNIDVSTSVVDDIDSNPSENLLVDTSFENSSKIPSTNWISGLGFFTGYLSEDGSISKTTARTGSKSLYINNDGTTRSVGAVQEINGWVAGDNLIISAYVKVTQNTGSEGVTIDLYGYDANNNPCYDNNGIFIVPTSSNFIFYSSSPERIPSNVKTLFIRIFAGKNTSAYVDDVRVRKQGEFTVEQVLDQQSWRNNSNKFLVNVSDTSININSTSGLQSILSQNNIYFCTLGTDSNKTQTQNIISSNSGKGIYIDNTNIDTALSNLSTYISNATTSQQSTAVSYILSSDSITCTPSYSDYENDSKYAENWYYVHDPNYVDNNNGVSFYDKKTLSTPVSTFDKVGKYDIQYKAMDNPANTDLRFLDYFLWSDPTPTSIIVHRKPIAQFTVQPGTLYITDTSYDPDFQYKRPDKGIVERYWQWKKTTDTNWTVGKPSSGIVGVGNYFFYLKVKDNYGVWSDPYQMAITVTDPNRPPVVDFNWTPTLIFEGDDVTLNNLTYDPDNDPLTYQWTVYNPKGATNTYTTKNIFLSNVVSGTYWVTLRAWDSKNATDVTTKSFAVKPLGISGEVHHTIEWNNRRISYNQSISGSSDSPRTYNTYWAGERFLLSAETTDTTVSATKATGVTVSFSFNGASVLLSKTGDNEWQGDMWENTFEIIPDGSYKFTFLAKYSNGVDKTTNIQIEIKDSMFNYYPFHRSE